MLETFPESRKRKKERGEKCKGRYSVFHRFGQAKFVNIVLILSPSQISLLPQLRQKTKLMSKVSKPTQK
jgi:hypothetical protein